MVQKFHVGLFFCLLLFILMAFCMIDCWGWGFYFGFDLFCKVIGLIFTQVKAHKGSLGIEEKLGMPINSQCNSKLFK